MATWLKYPRTGSALALVNLDHVWRIQVTTDGFVVFFRTNAESTQIPMGADAESAYSALVATLTNTIEPDFR